MRLSMKHEAMRIAVVIPAYQAAQTIGETLESVFAQSRPANDIVVVDDGSSDETAAEVGRHLRSGAAIRLFRQRRSGPALARNRAIAATNCELIAPIDADDLWDRDYLAAMSETLDGSPHAALAYCRHRLIDDRGGVIRDATPVPMNGACFGPMLLINPVGNGSAAVFRRDALLAAGGYRPPSDAWWGAEDYWLQLRLAARHPIALVERTLVSYRIHAASLSQDCRAAHRARLKAVDAALREFGPCPLPVRRWAEGDAARVQAVKALSRGHIRSAIGNFAYASIRDPAGTIADGALRCRNLLLRAVRESVPGHRLDALTAARLRRLQQAMPLARATGVAAAGIAAADRPERERSGQRSLPPGQPPDGDSSARGSPAPQAS